MIQEDRALWKYIVFGLLTCGIYPLIWYYSLGNRLAENAPRYGLNLQENGTTVLMWHIFGMLLCGLGVYIAMNILIKNTNAMAKAYNGGQKREPNQIESVTEAPVRTVYQQNSYTERETTMLSMEQAQKQAASQMPPRGVLYFVQTQQSVTVDKDEFRIGKNAGMSDYVITNNSSVSRQHAVIQRRNGQFFVTDLGSTNGTFVNEKRISGTVQLQDGDNIRYADVISVFNIVR